MTIAFISFAPFPPRFMTTSNYCYIYTAMCICTGSIDRFQLEIIARPVTGS